MLTPSYDIDRIRLRVLSLGAGVQSTTLALMAAHGEVTPMPDLAVFADTGWEPARVYEHLQWLASDNVLPFPIHVVSAGNIRDGLLRSARGERWASIPAFTRTVTPAGTRLVHDEEDADGEKRPVGQRVLARDEVAIGMITRQCTSYGDTGTVNSVLERVESSASATPYGSNNLRGVNNSVVE